jgi:hypothetical protein
MKNAEVHTAPWKPQISERLTWNRTNGVIGWAAMLFRRSQSAFCRSHALHHHVRGIGACIHWSTTRVATALGLTKPRHWCTSIPIRSSSARDQGQIQCIGTITISPRIQRAREREHETESERNDDGGNDDDGQNLEAFDWDGFSDDGAVGGAYARNRSPTPTGDGGVRDIQSSEDYDDVPSGDDGSGGNVRNGNDDDRDDNVHNENGEEAPNNAVVGGDVEAARQGPQNNVP